MKFIHQVIGKATKRNIEHLLEVGYVNYDIPVIDHYNKHILVKDGYMYIISTNLALAILIDKNENVINCSYNNKLFRYISAIRNDSDKHQLFTNGKDWCKCHTDTFNHFIYHIQKQNSSIDLINNWHKATVEELINFLK